MPVTAGAAGHDRRPGGQGDERRSIGITMQIGRRGEGLLLLRTDRPGEQQASDDAGW